MSGIQIPTVVMLFTNSMTLILYLIVKQKMVSLPDLEAPADRSVPENSLSGTNRLVLRNSSAKSSPKVSCQKRKKRLKIKLGLQ
jgi:hypothetical protein